MRSVLRRGICLASIFTVGSFGGEIADGTNAIRNGDYEQARAIFQTACDDNNAKGCFNLAAMGVNGYIQTDAKQTQALFEKACDLGHDRACEQSQNLRASTHREIFF